jgi:hypothetical protein
MNLATICLAFFAATSAVAIPTAIALADNTGLLTLRQPLFTRSKG